MENHTLHVLEFAKIKALLGRYLMTGPGRELLEELRPYRDLAEARQAMRLTSEARRAADQLLEAPLDPVHDLRPLLAQAMPEGAYLDPRQLLQVRDTLHTMARAAGFLRTLPGAFDLLRQWGGEIEPQVELEEQIEQTIDDEAIVRDNASRQLKSIRGSIREVQDWITRRLNRMLRRDNVRQYLQEPYYTLREDRHVLPVQSKYKSRIKGIVHDCSDSGTTTFIEPLEVVEQGNRLRELKAEEELEIRKVLRQLTALVRKAAAPISKNQEILARLDFAFAKGKFSLALGMMEPELSTWGSLILRRARHPLLVESLRDQVIPLDVELGEKSRTLVITGPNTGGKTVVLKTIGILCLMAAAGMHVPAGDGTRIVLYRKVFADIGDEQSLEQSLSTFSSHINQISRFLNECGDGVLVLIDELGTGTDPVEGGALGVEILRRLHERGAHTMVTTHLNELKVFAYETPDVENAAMAFDQETLRPAYRLSTGAPGSSYALEIAARLGMPSELIEQARRRLAGEKEDAATLLERLSEDLRQADQERRAARADYDKAQSLRLQVAERLDRLQREKDQILERSRHEARQKLETLQQQIREARHRLEEILGQAEAAALAEKVKESEKDLDRLRDEQLAMAKKAQKVFRPPREAPRYEAVELSQLRPGQTIRIQGFTLPGILLALDDKKKEAEVQVQSVHVRVPLGRILGIVKEEEKPPLRPVPTVTIEASSNDDLPHSIDIHGMTQDEAYPVLEKYIDAANLAGWPQVYIIHGHGMGVLRRMVQRLLEKHPLVHSYRAGDYMEGGTGVTVAILREG